MHDNLENIGKNDKLLSIGEASEYLGVSIDTLRRWEKKEKVKSYRSPGGHRYFRKNDLDTLFGRKYERGEELGPRLIKNPAEDNKNNFNTYEVPVENLLNNLPQFDQIGQLKVIEHEERKIEIPAISPIKISSKPSFEEYYLKKTEVFEIAIPETGDYPSFKKSILEPAIEKQSGKSTPFESQRNSDNYSISNKSAESILATLDDRSQKSPARLTTPTPGKTDRTPISKRNIIIIGVISLIFIAFVTITILFSSSKVISPIP